jgi:hypothetical protein
MMNRQGFGKRRPWFVYTSVKFRGNLSNLRVEHVFTALQTRVQIYFYMF